MSLDIWLETEVDTGGKEPHKVELYSGNITHNLNTMAEEEIGRASCRERV
jgi:hypothetical protein